MKHRIHNITHLALALALGAGLGASRAKAQALPVTDGLMVWLSADGVDPNDPTQVDGSGNVQQWNDLSGNSNNASNATASERPAYITNTMNGKPVLRFTEASSSKLFLGDLSASFWASGLPTIVDSSPTAANSGTGGAAINGTYANIPTRGVTGALVGDSDTAVSLNGSTQDVKIPWSAALNPATAGLSDPFTVEAWVKSNGAPAGSHVIVQSMRQPGQLGTVNDIPNDRSGWFLRHIGNDLQFAVGTATGLPFYYYYTVPGAVSATNWQHVAVVYDGDETPVIYIDKVAQTYVLTRQDGAPFNPGEAESIRVRQNTDCPAIIGNRAFGGWGFNGVIDEVAIYPSALSQPRIQAHFENGMNAPTPRTQPYSAEVLADAPVGYYRLNEPASNSPVAGASVFAVAAPNNDGRYNLFGNRSNDDRWVANTWTESSPGSFREGRAGFGAAGYALWPQSGAHVFSMESSASRYRFVIDGNQNSTLSTTGSYNSGAGANWRIGDSATTPPNDQRLNGDIAELLLFNRVLTPLEADQVGGYLTQKYGLTTTYPPLGLSVKLTNPVDTLAYPNGTAIDASASVVAGSVSGGTPPYTVEFWVNDLSVGTATTVDPYTRSLGTLANGSYTIYAKVTDSTSPTPITATSATHAFSVVPPIATTTTLTSSANPSTYGAGALTATVITSDSSVLAGGTVQFFDAGAPLGAPVPVNTATGQAFYSIHALGAGSHEITATYNGFGGNTASSAPALSQLVEKATLTVTANNVFRPTATSNLDPLPHEITGFQNGQTRATSGVTGQPVLETPAGPASPAGTYPITCTLGGLEAINYSFTLVNGTLTVADVKDSFSVNFYAFGAAAGWSTPEAQATIQLQPWMAAGTGDWLTSGWRNIVVPWSPPVPQPAVDLTSNRGSAAKFVLKTCRNGGPIFWGNTRTTLLDDPNGNLMDGHVNSTVDSGRYFEMEVSEVPFPVYDVVIYMGANDAQFGDGKGTIVFNGANPPREFTLKRGFDGEFIEMVDATTPGNYIIFRGVTGTSFTTRTEGLGFNHIGPTGFQVRSAVSDYGAWAQGFPGANLDDPNADFDGDGWTNDEERLFALNPTDGSSVNPIIVPLDSAAGTFSFTRRNDALTGKFTDIETSTDLQLWTVDAGAGLLVGAPENGVQRVDVTLSEGLLTAPKLFVRVTQRDARVPLSENFEEDNGDFEVVTTTGSPWVWGEPNSTGFGGTVTQGNGGSLKCWGTNIENPGLYINPTVTCLRSKEVDLTTVAAAQLTFAQALDISPEDSAVVNILDAATNLVIASAIYTATDANETKSEWEVANGGTPIPIPAIAIGRKVRIEWCLSGQTPDYFGWYIDDVTVQEVAP